LFVKDLEEKMRFGPGELEAKVKECHEFLSRKRLF